MSYVCVVVRFLYCFFSENMKVVRNNNDIGNGSDELSMKYMSYLCEDMVHIMCLIYIILKS